MQTLKQKCSKPGCGALKIIGKPCTDNDCPQQWVHHTNTRPAAPVEGLETVGNGVFSEGEMIGFVGLGFEFNPDDDRPREPLVKRSQAEAIIAAKDREIALAKSDRDEWGKIAYAGGYYQAECDLPEHETAAEALSEYRQLKADNAALTVRVKELEDYAREATKAITGLSGGGSENFGKAIGDLYPADLPFCLERIRDRYVSKVELKRLETQLTAAKKALDFYAVHVSGCRKIGADGDKSRASLDADGGATARAAMGGKP